MELAQDIAVAVDIVSARQRACGGEEEQGREQQMQHIDRPEVHSFLIMYWTGTLLGNHVALAVRQFDLKGFRQKPFES